MNSTAKIACATALLGSVFLSSCATIVSKSTWPVQVESQPTGLEFVVKNAEGQIVSNGRTPQTVSLDSGTGYFRSASYTIQTKRGKKVTGETTVTAKINGWYWGNLLFGGVIGMVIVDPLTGAMYSLPKTVTVNSGTTAATGPQALHIASIETLTPEQRASLVRL